MICSSRETTDNLEMLEPLLNISLIERPIENVKAVPHLGHFGEISFGA